MAEARSTSRWKIVRSFVRSFGFRRNRGEEGVSRAEKRKERWRDKGENRRV